MRRTASSGEVIAGRYRLERFWREESLSDMWFARALDTERDVEVKIPRLESDWEAFSDQARALMRLDHPCAVKGLDFGAERRSGRPFLVTERLFGTPLDWVLNQPMIVADAMKLVRGIVSLLRHAEGHGVIHPKLHPRLIEMVRGYPMLYTFQSGELSREQRDEQQEAIAMLLGALVAGTHIRSPRDGKDDFGPFRSGRPEWPPALTLLVTKLLDGERLESLAVVDEVLASVPHELRCTGCAAPLGDHRTAIVTPGRTGIEHRYYPCVACAHWNVITSRPRPGILHRWHAGLLSASTADACVRLIASCPDPRDPQCGCVAHMRLRHGVPIEGARLRSLFVAPEVEVTGYDERGTYDLSSESWITVGRTTDAEVRIAAIIGGRRTFTLWRRENGWTFEVANHHARANVDGRSTTSLDESVLLSPGTIIEVYEAGTDSVVHRFAFETFELDQLD